MKFGPINRAYKPASYVKSQKYVSDGSGRDKYVVYIFIVILDPNMEVNILNKMK